MSEYTARFDLRVRQECEVARAEGARRSYSEIAQALGLDRSSRGHIKLVSEALKRNMREDHRRGRPIASVAAVRVDTNLPGWGFWELAREFGLYQGGDYKAFVEEQWQRFCNDSPVSLSA